MRGSGYDGAELFAIADPAIIFPPVHFRRVSREVWPGDVVMGANLSATKAGEKAFDLIGAPIRRAVSLAMVDPLGDVGSVHGVPV